jgi:hypothetical protein
MINADMPAMPFVESNGYIATGLSKREYFAARAMEAIIASKHFEIQWWDQDEKQDSFSKSAWGYADAMLNAQEKEPTQ